MPDTFTKKAGTTVAFGDVVQLSTQKSTNPKAEGFERYLGLEHLVPGELKIRRWGDTADGTTFTNVFKPGQVLFGKRRAYQRKVAVAGFSGVCSGDIYVLEPKGDRLIPELLPFICHSEPFYDYVLSMSQGGLSPRVNWKALAKYEFALPPLDEQRRIAALLSGCARMEHSLVNLGSQLRAVARGLVMNTFTKSRSTCRWERLNDIGELELGLKKEREYEACTDPKPYLTVANITDFGLDLRDVKRMDFPGYRFEKHRLRHGDVLLTEGDITSPWNVGRAAIFRDEIESCCIQNTLMRIRVREDLEAEYVLLAFYYLRYSGAFVKASATTTVSHLVAKRAKEVPVPILSIDVRRELVRRYRAIERAMNELSERLRRARELTLVSSKLVLSR